MQRILLFLFTSLLVGTCAQGQVLMRDVLRQMPDSVVPYLSANNRLDFIDFIDSNMRAEVPNNLGGRSELQVLNERYARLLLNEASVMELRLLDVAAPADSTTQLICLVRTYGSDIRESAIAFYTPGWQQVDVPLPLPSEMFVAVLGETEPTLTVTPQCRLDAPASEDQEVRSEPSTILNWDGRNFK